MSALKPTNGDCSCSEAEPAESDEYYVQCMAEILDAYPKAGPPGHPTRLSEHLYIGNQDNADDAQLLSALDITHVLNMAGTRTFDLTRSPYKPESGIRSFLMMPAEDFEDYDMLPHLLEAIAFLSRAETSSGCAFVHCSYGVNRSGVVAAAYLMVSEHKPLLRVINELKAKRSVILSNVGFRRQLVRFARCRGLLDPVERPSRRSPRLEPGDRSPRSVTPAKDKVKDEVKDESNEPESSETGGAKETTNNGSVDEVPLRNGFHVSPPVLTISTDADEVNGLVSSIRRKRAIASHRERLLRDVDSTIETISGRTDTVYRLRDDTDRVPSPSVSLFEQPRPSVYLPHSDYTEPLSVAPKLSSQFDVVEFTHSYDPDEDNVPRSFVGERSNPILDEYLQYKTSSNSVRLPPSGSAALAEPFMSIVKPRSHSHYSRPSTTSSVMDEFDDAVINSFLAVRSARKFTPSPRSHVDHSAGLDPRRRSASSLEAILGSRPSSGTRIGGLQGGHRPSPEAGLLPASAYVGRWYPTSTASRRHYAGTSTTNPSSYLIGVTSSDLGRYDSDGDVNDKGHIGRTIATRVTPAPGYGPTSSYARSHSVSRLL